MIQKRANASSDYMNDENDVKIELTDKRCDEMNDKNVKRKEFDLKNIYDSFVRK